VKPGERMKEKQMNNDQRKEGKGKRKKEKGKGKREREKKTLRSIDLGGLKEFKGRDAKNIIMGGNMFHQGGRDLSGDGSVGS
jgi:hypothetical protein